MSADAIMGFIRHILTFLGGLAVTKGLLDEGLVVELVGGVMTIVGVVWSFIDKYRRQS